MTSKFRHTVMVVFIGGTILVSALALAGDKARWGYTGKTGPKHWGSLNSQFELCATGKNQSPINLSNVMEAELPPIAFHYATMATDIVNNGHTIQVNYASGSTIAIAGKTFELHQFHFHAPSENQIQGQSFPMEAHLVHADAAGNLAVIAVLLQAGRHNALIDQLWKHMPAQSGEKRVLPTPIDALELLPRDKAYFRFNGSLTTPPCTEGVWWFVMKQPVIIAKRQVEVFEHIMHHPNNRPVQSVNARPILQ